MVNGINSIVYGDGSYTAVQKQRLLDLGLIDNNGNKLVDFTLLSESAQQEIAADFQEFVLSDDFVQSGSMKNLTAKGQNYYLVDQQKDKNELKTTLDKYAPRTVFTPTTPATTATPTTNNAVTNNTTTTTPAATGNTAPVTQTPAVAAVPGTINGIAPSGNDDYQNLLATLASKMTSSEDTATVLASLGNLDATAINNLKSYIKANDLASEKTEKLFNQASPTPGLDTKTIATNLVEYAKSADIGTLKTYLQGDEFKNLSYGDKVAIQKALKEAGFDINKNSIIKSALSATSNVTATSTEAKKGVKGAIDGIAPDGSDAYQTKLKTIAEELNKLKPGDDPTSILSKYKDLDPTALANIREYLKDKGSSPNASAILDQLSTTLTADPKTVATKIKEYASSADTTNLEDYIKSDEFKKLTYADKQAIIKELQTQGFDASKYSTVNKALNSNSDVVATNEQIKEYTALALKYNLDPAKKAEVLNNISKLSTSEKMLIAKQADIRFDGTKFVADEDNSSWNNSSWNNSSWDNSLLLVDNLGYFGLNNNQNKRNLAAALNNNLDLAADPATTKTTSTNYKPSSIALGPIINYNDLIINDDLFKTSGPFIPTAVSGPISSSFGISSVAKSILSW